MSRMNGKFLRPPTDHIFEASSDEDDSNSEDEKEETALSTKLNKNNGNNNNRTNGISANLSSDDSDDDDNDDDESNDNEDEDDQDGSNDDESNDDEEQDDEEEEDEEETPSRNTNQRSKRSHPKSNSNKKSKKKTRLATDFFDEEAEASDEDEEDEEAYGTHHDPHDIVKKHYTEDDIRREHMDAEAKEIIERQNKRRQNGSLFSESMDAAEIAREIEERHAMDRKRVSRSVLQDVSSVAGVEGYGGAYNTSISAVSQQSLLPSVSDPKLWMFSCSPGKEEELVYQIMNKCISFAKQGRAFGITSVVAAQSKGKIYVESPSEPSVMEAVQGIRNLMSYTMRLVPIHDMTTVMNVIPKKRPVKPNEWVRMTRGHYKGDLALVRDVIEDGLKCIVQCVPRLDLTLSDLPAAEAKIRRRTVKPPQKFFNQQEIAALGKVISGRQDLGNFTCDYFEGNHYHDGYLLKEVKVGTMIKPCTEDDPPTLDELQRFRKRKGTKNNVYDPGDGDDDDDEENEGSKQAKSLLDELSELQGKTGLADPGGTSANSGGLIIGDTIEVVEGDLIGMRGKMLSIDGSTVKIKPINTDGLGSVNEIEFLISQVRKHIAVGAHVKVTGGRYANETGVVVAVEQLQGETDSTAVLVTDMTHKEISGEAILVPLML